MKYMYITPYKKSDITDKINYKVLYRNTLFYIGIKEYQQAKNELLLLSNSKDSFVKLYSSRISFYQEEAQRPNNKHAGRDESEAKYYQDVLEKHQHYMKKVEALLEVLENEDSIIKWREDHIHNALEIINQKIFLLVIIRDE